MDNKYFTIRDLYTLLSFDERYRYVARDKDGTLCVYEKEPAKGISAWMVTPGDWYATLSAADKYVLRCAEWDDDKPIWIPPKKVIESVIAKRLSDAVVMSALFKVVVDVNDN